MSIDVYTLCKRNRLRAILLFLALCCLVGFIADVVDHQALTGGIPATVTRASTFTPQANPWLASGDGQQDARITPDSGTAFVYPLVFSRTDIEHRLADGSPRIKYVTDRPARHWRDGEPLPPLDGYLLGLSLLLAGVFGLSLRVR